MLNYDAQIDYIFPSALFRDAVCGQILQQIGINLEAASNKILLFTDPRTVSALHGANEDVKALFISSGIGLAVYGWSAQNRANFLIETMRGIAAKYAPDPEALRLAVFDLHRFVIAGMRGQLDKNPFMAPLTPLGPGDKFDLADALAALSSPDQIHKPKEEFIQRDRNLRSAKPFGRRMQ